MARVWAGRRRVDRCRVCMVSPAHCTCGWRGTPAAPGADAGGHLMRKLESEPPAPAPGEFTFESIEEYRGGD